MQEKTDRNTIMTIRVPKDLAVQIKEVSRKENITVGTALKFLIEQAANDKIEERLISLECSTNKIAKLLEKETGAVTKDYLSRVMTEEQLQEKWIATLSSEERMEILKGDYRVWREKWGKRLADFARPFVQERLRKDIEKIRGAKGLEKHIRPDRI